MRDATDHGSGHEHLNVAGYIIGRRAQPDGDPPAVFMEGVVAVPTCIAIGFEALGLKWK